MIEDSGERRQFESGAVRDVTEGKGRCDLLPLDVISDYLDDGILMDINDYIRSSSTTYLWDAIDQFCCLNYAKDENDDSGIYTGFLEVSKQYQDGSKKYGDRNWEKGIPLHCYIDSAVRHYLKFLRGDTDEPHDRAFLWNLLGAIWTQRHRPKLNDLPAKVVLDDAEDPAATLKRYYRKWNEI